MTDVSTLSISALRSGIARGDFSAVEVTQYFLERIEATQSSLSAFISVDADNALSQAGAVDVKVRNGERIGLLGGVPISVKDIIDVKGMATTCCSRSALDKMAEDDADVVTRLRAEDAIIIGKANCHEFAFGGPSFDLPFPPARNPWNPDCFPGGSSSGSGVGVAASLCVASIGTDTAGSIRLPSAHCGIVGLKPGYDVVSRRGVRPLSVTMDHVGPLARDVDDCRVVYDCLVGAYLSDDPCAQLRSGDLATARFGLAIAGWALEGRLHPEVLAIYNRVAALIDENGGQLGQVQVPPLDLIHAAASVMMMGEVAANYSEAVRGNYSEYGSVFRTRTLAGETVRIGDYLAAVSVRDDLTREVDALFDEVDFILLPVSLNPPGKLVSVDRFYFLADPNINILSNFVGVPSLTLPCGLSSSGLPIGLQILGRRGTEAVLFDVAEGLEKHIGFQKLVGPSFRIFN